MLQCCPVFFFKLLLILILPLCLCCSSFVVYCLNVFMFSLSLSLGSFVLLPGLLMHSHQSHGWILLTMFFRQCTVFLLYLSILTTGGGMHNINFFVYLCSPVIPFLLRTFTMLLVLAHCLLHAQNTVCLPLRHWKHSHSSVRALKIVLYSLSLEALACNMLL